MTSGSPKPIATPLQNRRKQLLRSALLEALQTQSGCADDHQQNIEMFLDAMNSACQYLKQMKPEPVGRGAPKKRSREWVIGQVVEAFQNRLGLDIERNGTLLRDVLDYAGLPGASGKKMDWETIRNVLGSILREEGKALDMAAWSRLSATEQAALKKPLQEKVVYREARTCMECLQTKYFKGNGLRDINRQARDAGWIIDTRKRIMRCPACVAGWER